MSWLANAFAADRKVLIHSIKKQGLSDVTLIVDVRENFHNVLRHTYLFQHASSWNELNIINSLMSFFHNIVKLFVWILIPLIKHKTLYPRDTTVPYNFFLSSKRTIFRRTNNHDKFKNGNNTSMNHIILMTPLNGFNELKNIVPNERRFKAWAVTLHVFLKSQVCKIHVY